MALSIGHSEHLADPPDEWLIECVNCDCIFVTTPFDAEAFCSPGCHDVARAVRYGRKQVARFGPPKVWTDEVLRGAVGRVPEGVLLAEVNRRWEAAPPERACDDVNWNENFQAWITRRRRVAVVVQR